LKDEITIINSEAYKKAITWSYTLETLISAMQVYWLYLHAYTSWPFFR